MKKIKIFISLITIISLFWFVYFVVLGNGRSGHYYSSPEREVEQLSDDYYLGPVIDENKSYISNIRHFEILDGVTKSASPIGYYIQFDYRKDEIDCEITIISFPFEKYEGALISENVHKHKGYEIYLHDCFGEYNNLVWINSMSILGDYILTVSVDFTNSEINYEHYQEISKTFMLELVDNYVANSN